MQKNNSSHISHYQDKLKYEIDSWDLNKLLQEGKKVIVIDVRSAAAYKKEHIMGAISFHHKEINQDSVREILVDGFEVLYVTYCDGIGCNASTKGALKLAELGYGVKELIGGIEWWKRDRYLVVQE
jgi:rhodanese-related sulfurtransferase